MIKNIIIILIFLTFLTACTAEKSYRGVADPFWKELTAEQKQLIVDQSYEQEFGQEFQKEGKLK